MGKGGGKIEPCVTVEHKVCSRPILVHLRKVTARREHLASVTCKKSYETQGFVLDNYNLRVIQCNHEFKMRMDHDARIRMSYSCSQWDNSASFIYSA